MLFLIPRRKGYFYHAEKLFLCFYVLIWVCNTDFKRSTHISGGEKMNKVFRKSLHSMIGVGMILAVGTICALPVSADGCICQCAGFTEL